jgi:FkbM family methyltransferase
VLDIFRRFSWRLGRKAYCWARGDLANRPTHNGEYWLLGQVISLADSDPLFVDIGANLGDWSSHAVSCLAQAGKKGGVIAFEPSSKTRELLTRRLASSRNVEVCALALSSSAGVSTFYSSEIGAGTNSLSEVSGPNAEAVNVTTLDGFFQERAISRASMVKVDTEGFDLEVLRGATETLARGAIDVVQFEYNWRWLLNGASMLALFEFIKDKPYRVGKLAGPTIQFFDIWHHELDRFFENNYVLVRRGSRVERLGRAASFDRSNCAVLS